MSSLPAHVAGDRLHRDVGDDSAVARHVIEVHEREQESVHDEHRGAERPPYRGATYLNPNVFGGAASRGLGSADFAVRVWAYSVSRCAASRA